MWVCFVAGGRAQVFDLLVRGDGMAAFRGRDLHLVKKALAIASARDRTPAGTLPAVFGSDGHRGAA